MASKANVGQIVITALGAVVSPVVAVLLVTPLDSGSTLAVMALSALRALALGVAAGLATIFAARLLTFLGRKVRPWFRIPATKLKALEPQIEDLYRYNMHQLLDSKQIDDLSVKPIPAAMQRVESQAEQARHPVAGAPQRRVWACSNAWRPLTRNARRTATRPNPTHLPEMLWGVDGIKSPIALCAA